MFEAFHERDFQVVSSSFMLGYGILIFFSHDYLNSLKPVNLVVQSTAVGLIFHITPLYSYRKSLNFEGLNEEKSEEKYDLLRTRLLITSIFTRVILTILGILI
jgi:hypothetical protein